MRSIIIPAALAGYAVAKSATVAAPANLFIGAEIGNKIGSDGFAASIINACADTTTYSVQCTSGPASRGCGPDATDPAQFTVTQGPSTYIDDVLVSSDGGVLHGMQTCDLQGTTAASCHGVLVLGASGSTTSAPYTTSYKSDAASYYFQVPVTASASATSCSSTGAAEPTNAKKIAGMGLAGAMGVAGLFAL